MRHALDHAEYLRDRLTKAGKFQVLNETQRIPVVALTLDKSVTRYNEFDISNKVRERGWILAAYSMPPDAQEVNSLRIVVRPHMNSKVASILADDIERACVSRKAWRQCNPAEAARSPQDLAEMLSGARIEKGRLRLPAPEQPLGKRFALFSAFSDTAPTLRGEHTSLWMVSHEPNEPHSKSCFVVANSRGPAC